MMKLVDKAKLTVTQGTTPGLVKAGNSAPADQDRTAGRRIQTTEQMQERALARAGNPDHRHAFTARHRQIHALEHRHGGLPLAVLFAQITALDGRTRCGDITHSARPPPD